MVSQQMQQILEQAQLYQQQLQSIVAQKENLRLQLMEIEKALEELSKTKETTVYKITGPLLVKAKTTEVKKELEDKQKFINFKIKTLEDSEKRVQKRLDEIKTKLSEFSSKKSKDVSVGE
jgi:prefoldin beta subunit